MSARSDQSKRMRELERAGFDVRLTANGHYRIVAPNGEIHYAGSTPSDHRAAKNLMSWVRRQQRACAS